MAYFFYNLLVIVLLPLIVMGVVFQNLNKFNFRFIKTIPERFFLPAFGVQEKPFWIHCSSLGEAKIGAELIRRLRADFPNRAFYISVVTLTAYDWLKGKKTADAVFFAPFDFCFTAKQFVKRLAPAALIIVETEIWPNLIKYARKSGAVVVLANARISERNFNRMEKISFFVKRALENFDLFFARTKTDSQRLLALGAESGRIILTGNVKFDIEEHSNIVEPVHSVKKVFGLNAVAPVITAGSIREKEFKFLLDAYVEVKKVFADSKLILAPRHIPNIPGLIKAIKARRLAFSLFSVPDKQTEDGIIILDVYGLLQKAYYISDLCIVGGGFADYGGQNIIEPAMLGRPIICGRYMGNFKDSYELLSSRNAILAVEARGISEAAIKLLSDKKYAFELGANAARAVSSQKGALEKSVTAIKNIMQRSG